MTYQSAANLWISQLLRFCVHNRTVLESTARYVSVPHLPSILPCSAHYLSILSSLILYWNKYQKLPTFESFGPVAYTDYNILIQKYGTAMHTPYADTIEAIFSPMQPGEDIKPILGLIAWIDKKTRVNPSISKAYATFQASQDLKGLQESIQRLALSSLTERESRNPFGGQDMQCARRIYSGISWFDSLINGGLRCGSAYGLLTPTGGGKTTFSVFLTVSLAKNNHKVLLAATEEAIDDAEYLAKFWAAMTNKPIDNFSKYRNPSEFPDSLISAADKAAYCDVGERIKLFSFGSKHGGTDEICKHVECLQPDVLILDWAGEFANYLVTSGNKLGENLTLALKHLADTCAQIAREYNIVVLVMHQIASAEIAGPMKLYDHTMASNCKQFFYDLGYGLTISPIDTPQSRICCMRCTKGRYGIGLNGEVVLRLDGNLAKFTKVDGYKRGRRQWETYGNGELPSEPVAQKKSLHSIFSME